MADDAAEERGRGGSRASAPLADDAAEEVGSVRAVLFDFSGTLFGVLWRTDGHRMDALPDHPVMRRWWAHMADIMVVKPDNEPVATPLVTVFHMP